MHPYPSPLQHNAKPHTDIFYHGFHPHMEAWHYDRSFYPFPNYKTTRNPIYNTVDTAFSDEPVYGWKEVTRPFQ